MTKIHNLALSLLLIGGVAFTSGCNSARDTNKLRPGMSVEEVTSILGSPSETHFRDGTLIYRYSLHAPWVGWKPAYLSFDPQTNRLIGWATEEKSSIENYHFFMN